MKATEGISYQSASYLDQVAAAGDKYFGAYHYTGTPGNDAKQEADNFLKIYNGEGIIALDVETAVTPTFVLAWCDYIKSKMQRTPIIYTNWAWLKPLRTACTVEQWERLVEYPLWLAEVAEPGKNSTVDPKPGSTKGWPVVLHQYAYTPLAGNAIDRDWTADLEKLRSL